MTLSFSHGLHWEARRAFWPAATPGQSQRVRAWLAFALLCVSFAFACVTAVGAQSGAHDASLERNVKAAFLYKFLGYVDYPEHVLPPAGEPLVIGILGADDVAEELVRIAAGRSMNGRPVVVRKLRQGDALGKVQMLFIGDDDAADVDRALAAVKQLPVLTVTETGRNLRQDSVINFRVVDERVRFEVSLDAAEKSNLKLSSRLLAVAYKVQRSNR